MSGFLSHGLVPIAIGAVAVVLLLGLTNMMRGGSPSTSQKLIDRVKADVDAKHAAGMTGPIPADAVTTSGSGLDPDISPEYALAQVTAVAKARNLPEDKVRDLVQAHIEGRALRIFGEPRVNVLLLNIALDGLSS